MAANRVWINLLKRATIAIAIAAGIIAIPSVEGNDILRYKDVAVVLVLITFLGKILYDTLFYDRFTL